MAKEDEQPAEAVEEVAAADIEVSDMQNVRASRPSTDANTFIMILVGVVGTLVTAFGVMPLKGTKLTYLYGIVNQRGPVQYLELLMSFMVAAMIVLKSRVVNRNLRIIASNPIPPDLDLNDDKAMQEFRDSLPSHPEFEWSILLNRIDRAIALWLGSKDVGRVATWASSESARDVSASDSSYALSRVLMWAIPILGFIGTVQGLGQAVAGFGVLGGSADVSAIKSAIGQVTVGLGVAFDTTLLALVLTTLLMFPLTSFQRKEEGLFGELDNYLDDTFLARLPSPEQQPIVIENLEDSIEAAFRRYIPDPDRYDEVFTRAIEKAAASTEDRFNNLSKNYELTLRDLTEKLSQNLQTVGLSLADTMKGVVVDVRKQDDAMINARKQIGADEAAAFKGIVSDIHSTSEKVAAGYRQSAEAIEAITRDGAQKTVGAAKELAAKLDEVAKLTAGIQDLLKINQAVEKSLTGMQQADDFKNMLGDLRKHLSATTDFCNRLSKPRVITLREE